VLTVAVVNQKGGVGKTTVTLGLASAAYQRGVRTLVVDMDPQGNASSGLGVWDAPLGVDHALLAAEEGTITEVVRHSSWTGGGWFVPAVAPSTPDLSVAEPRLQAEPRGAHLRLRRALEGATYELVLIDCPPSIGMLTLNALFAADAALVVTEPGAWSSDGVVRILQAIERVADRRDPPLRLAGILCNRLGRTRDARYWHEHLRAEYGDDVLPPVHLRAALPEAAARSLPIHATEGRPGAAEAAAEFDVLLSSLLQRGAGHARVRPSA
jgi:chromosome partitioning protein